MLPAILSLLGLAGTTAALVAGWLSPVLALMSAGLLGRSYYSLYVQRRGTRTSEIATWLATALVALMWTARLLGG
jgi:hypothetical protein